jgi:hypothetical protein
MNTLNKIMPYVYISLAVAVLLGTLFLCACQPRTLAYDPNANLTAMQVNAQISADESKLDQDQAAINAGRASVRDRGAAAGVDIEQQIQTRQQITQVVAPLITTALHGTIDPVTMVGSGVTILGLLTGAYGHVKAGKAAVLATAPDPTNV